MPNRIKRRKLTEADIDSIPTLFSLVREEDETGVSGTGIVAHGVIFSDGHVAMRWLPGPAGHCSTVTYESIEAVEAIHGHNGKTVVVTFRKLKR